jgi:hypothetical protein
MQPEETILSFFGEDIKPTPSGHYAILRARLMRNVDGLDVKLFEKALEVRRKFEQEREHLSF